MKTAVFYVEAISCVNCKNKVEKALSALPRVSMVNADAKTRKVTINFDGDVDVIASRLKEIGFPGVLE